MRLSLVSALAVGALGAKAKPCVEVRGFARPSYPGYDHVVNLKNTCDKPAACSVATNVNPTAVKVTVGAKSQKSVLTFRGSPARVFTPRVSCKLGR